jgi:hypothetical protein
MRRTLKIAEAYEEQARRASRDSGLDEVDLRIVGLDQDIRELVPEAFAYTPVTAAGCVAQARCFLLAYEWARDPSFIAVTYGRPLAEAVAALSDGGRDA